MHTQESSVSLGGKIGALLLQVLLEAFLVAHTKNDALWQRLRTQFALCIEKKPTARHWTHLMFGIGHDVVMFVCACICVCGCVCVCSSWRTQRTTRQRTTRCGNGCDALKKPTLPVCICFVMCLCMHVCVFVSVFMRFWRYSYHRDFYGIVRCFALSWAADTHSVVYAVV